MIKVFQNPYVWVPIFNLTQGSTQYKSRASQSIKHLEYSFLTSLNGIDSSP